MQIYHALLLGTALALGCGSGESFQFAPVSGTVTMDGEPLDGATVVFQPAGDAELAPNSFGHTDQQGRYSLEVMTTGEKGAQVGPHRVLITLDEYENSRSDARDISSQEENPIPPRYNTETQLTFEVPANGTDSADFDLSSQ